MAALAALLVADGLYQPLTLAVGGQVTELPIEFVDREGPAAALGAQTIDGLRNRGLKRDATSLLRDDVVATIADLHDVADLHIELLHSDGHASMVPAAAEGP